MASTEIKSPAETLARTLSEKGYSQATFAKKIGVTRQYLNGILKGKYPFNLSLALKLADGLGGTAEEWMSESRDWEQYLKSPEGRGAILEREAEEAMADFALRGRGYLLGYEVGRAMSAGMVKIEHFSEDQLTAEGCYLLRAASYGGATEAVDLRRAPLTLNRGARALVFSAESFELGENVRLEFGGLSENFQSAYLMTSQAQVMTGASRLSIPLYNAGEEAVEISHGTDLALVRFYFDAEAP